MSEENKNHIALPDPRGARQRAAAAIATPRFALIYIVLSGLWMGYSERLLRLFLPAGWQEQAQWLGVGVFVSATASLLLLALHRHARALEVQTRRAALGNLLGAGEGLQLERYRDLIERVPVMLFVCDLGEDGSLRPVYVSPQVRWILGYTSGACVESERRNWRDWVFADDHSLVEYMLRTRARPDEHFAMEFRLPRADGRIAWVSALCSVAAGSAPGVRRLQGTLADVTERREAEEARAQTERIYRDMFELSPVPMWVFDVESRRFLAVNDAAIKHYGYSRDEFLALQVDDIRPAEDVPLLHEVLAGSADRHYAAEHMWRHKRRDGSVFFAEVTANPLRFRGRRARLVIARDMTEKLAAEIALRQAAAVFENTQEGAIIADHRGRVLAVNRACCEIGGYSEAELLGRSLRALRAATTLGGAEQRAIWRALRHEGQWRGEVLARRLSGELFPAWVTLSAVREAHGHVANYLCMFADISQLKRYEEQLLFLAHHDALTGLPNRVLLDLRLRHALERAGRYGHTVAVLFFDLDRFKYVNDSLGHPAGDELLCQVAERLRSRLRTEDTLARVGGDEFVAVLEDVSPRDAARIASDLIESISRPVRLRGGHDVAVGTSLGISLAPKHGSDPTALISHADAAMYLAKEAGRGTFRFYTEDLTRAANERLNLEARIRQALAGGEFDVFYQPRLRLADGALSGVEALVRWRHPEQGVLLPERFLAIAEETGLTLALGEFVLDTALAQHARWLRQGLLDAPLAVNLSPRQFDRDDLIADLAARLEWAELAPEYLVLEIPEATLTRTGREPLAQLARLRRLGVGIAVDDFGTGQISLAHLRRLELTELKIDRGVIAPLPGEPGDLALPGAIIAIARHLGMQVCAEGVEREAQLACLRELGCDHFQGQLVTSALPSEAFGRWLLARQAN